MTDLIVLLIALLLTARSGLVQRLDRVTVFHLWMLWSVFASVGSFGMLSARWPVAVVAGALGLYWWISTRPAIRWEIVWPALLAAIALGSVVYSLTPQYSFLRAGGLILVLLFGVLGTVGLATTTDATRALFRSIAIGMIVLACYVVLGANPGGFDLTNDVRLAAGTLRATGAANFALTGIIVLLYAARVGSRGVAIASWIMVAGLLYTIVATGTRGALLAAAVVLPLEVVALWGRKAVVPTILAYILVGVLVPLTLSVTNTTDRALEFFRMQSAEQALWTRVEGRWDVALPKALERPLIGRGFGTSRFYADDDDFVQDQQLDASESLSLTHNQYLAVFYELGVLGLIPFLTFALYTAVHAVSAVARGDPSSRARGACLAAFWLQMLFDMVFHDGRLTVGNGFAYWYWIVAILLIVSGRIANATRLVVVRPASGTEPADPQGELQPV